MGKKVITMSLSEKSIQNAIQELRAYQNSVVIPCYHLVWYNIFKSSNLA